VRDLYESAVGRAGEVGECVSIQYSYHVGALARGLVRTGLHMPARGIGCIIAFISGFHGLDGSQPARPLTSEGRSGDGCPCSCSYSTGCTDGKSSAGATRVESGRLRTGVLYDGVPGIQWPIARRNEMLQMGRGGEKKKKALKGKYDGTSRSPRCPTQATANSKAMKAQTGRRGA